MDYALLSEPQTPARTKSWVVAAITACIGLCLLAMPSNVGTTSLDAKAAIGDMTQDNTMLLPYEKEIAEFLGEAGAFLLILPNLGAGLALGVKGFTGIAETVGMPFPQLMGIFAVIFNLVGSGLILIGPLLPDSFLEQTVFQGAHPQWSVGGIMSMTGAGMLICFLVIATCEGHCKPYFQAEGDQEKTGHFLSIQKNIGTIGGLFVVASQGAQIGQLGFLRDVFGRILACVPCMVNCWVLGPTGFANIAAAVGVPFPTINGWMGVLCTGGGSVLVIIARFFVGL